MVGNAHSSHLWNHLSTLYTYSLHQALLFTVHSKFLRPTEVAQALQELLSWEILDNRDVIQYTQCMEYTPATAQQAGQTQSEKFYSVQQRLLARVLLKILQLWIFQVCSAYCACMLVHAPPHNSQI